MSEMVYLKKLKQISSFHSVSKSIKVKFKIINHKLIEVDTNEGPLAHEFFRDGDISDISLVILIG